MNENMRNNITRHKVISLLYFGLTHFDFFHKFSVLFKLSPMHTNVYKRSFSELFILLILNLS